MRAKRVCQIPLTIELGDHEHLAELREVSRILESVPAIAELAHTVLTRDRRADRGREALSAEQVVRAAVLYKMHDWSYRELEFELQFNEAYRSFCRLRWDQRPKRSPLNRDIKAISAECWQAINRALIRYANGVGIEDGKTIAVDKLRNFRAGIEGVISFLKRAFGAARCRWKGRASFHAYVWSSVDSANLLVLARHALA